MEYENDNFYYGLLIEDLIMGCERGGDYLKTKIDYCKYGIFDMDFGPHSRNIPLEKRVDWSDLEPLFQCLENRGVSRSQVCEIPDGDPVNKGAFCRLEYVIHLKSYDFYFGRMENRIIEGAVNEWRFDTTIDTYDNLADFHSILAGKQTSQMVRGRSEGCQATPIWLCDRRGFPKRENRWLRSCVFRQEVWPQIHKNRYQCG